MFHASPSKFIKPVAFDITQQMWIRKHQDSKERKKLLKFMQNIKLKLMADMPWRSISKPTVLSVYILVTCSY